MSPSVTTMRRITYCSIAISFLVLILLIVRHVTSVAGDVAQTAAFVSIISGTVSLYRWRGRR